jgi:hypothetical protein
MTQQKTGQDHPHNYNGWRRHSSLGYLSPLAFERRRVLETLTPYSNRVSTESGQLHVHPKADEFSREFGHLVESAGGMPVLDNDVLAFCVAELTQPLPEPCSGGRGRRGLPDHPDAGNIPRGLRPRGERTNQDCENEHEDGDEGSDIHSTPAQRCCRLAIQ